MQRGGVRKGVGRPKKGEIMVKSVHVYVKKRLIERQCVWCGKSYISERKKTYCSRECCLSANHRKQISFIHVCQKCGKEFQGKKNQKYCSGQCARRANSRTSSNGTTEKRCTVCGEWKSLIDNFYKSKSTYDGFGVKCKLCSSKKHLAWSQTKRGKLLRKINRIKNIETSRSYNKKIQPLRNEQEKIKARTDVSFQLNRRMRCLMWQGLRKNKAGRTWKELIGYSVDELRSHLEQQFVDGMTWELFLQGEIHIDHKIPRAAFNFTTPDDIDFKRCWSLSNLQPLWALDNIIKHDKIEKSFQPSVPMAI